MRRPRWQRLRDRVGLPLLMWLSSDQARRLGFTPIDDERLLMAHEHCRGRLLDVGCGSNELVRRHRERGGAGAGVDVVPWRGADAVCDTARLPFPDGAFDTVSMLACLNHIRPGQRDQVLADVRRVLRDDGRLVVTMINPVVGLVVHTVRRRHDPDQLDRGMAADEDYGLWPGEVVRLLERNGFRLVRRVPFVLGLNRLYVGAKQAPAGPARGDAP